MADNTCKNCERATALIKDRLLELGYQIEDAEETRNNLGAGERGSMTSQLNKLHQSRALLRSMLRMVDPVPEVKTGIFNKASRKKLDDKNRR